MIYTISLYAALTVFGLGLVYKITSWFRYGTSLRAAPLPASTRVPAFIKGILTSLFSLKLLTLLRVFILDGLLQLKLLEKSFLRWFIHLCVYGGILLLLLMHALEGPLTSSLFRDYASTVNPYMVLRDIFAAFAILGLGLALYRRFVAPEPRLRTNAMDSYLIILLGIIILSGVLLEGLKIVSYSKYEEMVEAYADTDEKEELARLESLWVEKYGLVSPRVKGPFDESTLEKGYDLHEMSCAACHSRPQWAFLGYGISRAVKPAALTLDRAHVPSILWYIHFLACFLALASLPFTKFFHMITGPLSLMANAIMERGRSEEANLATKEAMELDACTHCGLCTAQCSVGILVEKITNENILPSEKMVSLKALASGRKLSQKDLGNIVDGIYLCTNCNRCTVVCPVGINLKDLWLNVREYLLGRERPEVFVLSPFSFYRGLMKEAIPRGDYQKPLDSAVAVLAETYRPAASAAEPLTIGPDDRTFQGEVALSEQAKTYSGCFGCQTCTTVCPVVGAYDDPGHEVGLLPHQIMHAVALGMRNLAFGSRMLWDCLTCYQCQEQCPQGVCVTDVFYELKNMAVKHLKEEASS